MKIARTLKTAAFAVALTAIAPAAFADSGEAYVNGTNPSVLKVKSNGQNYTKLDLLGNFAIGGKLKFSTGATGRVKSWQAYPTITNGYGIASQIPGMAIFKKSQSYPIGNRPKTLNLNLNFPIPGNVVQNAAVSMCNWKADNLRNQGKSDKWIFDRNHDVHFELGLNASVDSSGTGSNNQFWEYTAPHNFTVRCMKWSGSRIPTAGGDKASPDATHGTFQQKTTLSKKAKRRATRN